MGNIAKHPAREKLELLIASKAGDIDAEEVRRLLIRFVINNRLNAEAEDIGVGLLLAYNGFTWDGSLSTRLSRDEAVSAFHQAALRGYRLDFPETTHESARLPEWPECLRASNYYPAELLDEIGMLIGYAEAQEDKALFARARKRKK